jgi:hypothetical protein
MSTAKRVSEDRACFRSHRAHSVGSLALALEISRRRWGDGPTPILKSRAAISLIL